ncbi:MAG: transketolase [Candidatus Competibacteraceae bacterium]|jgi:transketolase|nr:transketolase [Candidatus Competibacteraceae bacterium]
MPSRKVLANAIRALTMDAVQQANSGHPGAPMGMAEMGEVLWNDYLRHNPANPKWSNRDRVVLSNGHGSMLLYSVLHLSGYDLPMEELRNFRQLGSRTPGHPEYGHTPGVETTTGPLGQGLANAVGMAIAEHVLAAEFNRPGYNIIDHYTYAFIGDGCLMEGLSHEVCSLASTLGLGKLICLYDDNDISIDGDTLGWFTDETPKRFEAYHWHVIPDVDGHDSEAIKNAIEQARAVTDRPSIICCKTLIGCGAPRKAGSSDVHGSPLGAEEVAATRKHIGWHYEPFQIPEEIYAGWDARGKGNAWEQEWDALFAAYQAAHPELGAELARRLQGELPAQWEEKTAAYILETAEKAEDLPSRSASQRALNAYGPMLPELLGGSADLTLSNNTFWDGSIVIERTGPAGNYLYYGVREFGMSAIMNGMALHGGFIPYGGTFLTFADYCRNAVRMAAINKIRVLFVFTHDSIGVGEDGPTHHPIEHLASLRLIPDLSLWRPCDVVETAVAWKAAVERLDGPTCMAFSRQKLFHQPRTPEQIDAIQRGGYVLVDCEGLPEAIIIATGSEMHLATGAAAQLSEQGRKIRVVSMPSVDTFEQQDLAYREAVLPPSIIKRVAVEAGATASWYKFVGLRGRIIGLDCFGLSAPGDVLFKHFGFTVANVVQTVEELLAT